MTAFYLKKLTLHNFATFKQQTINFSPKYNALIGETGSGKSLILDALEILLGERADKKFIRSQTPFAVIEALFITTHPEIKNYFESIGHPFENNEVVVKRVIYADRPAQSFLNFQQCPLQTLQDMAAHFIDFVGQFDNQRLLHQDYQLQFLDHYGELGAELKEYQSLYAKWKRTKNILEELELKIREQNQRKDYLLYQLQEIKEIRPDHEEEQKLLEQKKELQLRERRGELLQQILYPLCESDEDAVIRSLKKQFHLLQKNEDCFESDILKLFEEAIFSLESAAHSLSQMCYREEDNVGKMESILHRLSEFAKLKSKYRLDLLGIAEQSKNWENELEQMETLAHRRDEAYHELQDILGHLQKSSKSLYLQRKEIGERLGEDLTAAIQELNMEGARIKIEIKQLDELTINGGVTLQFLAETNPGEGFFPFKAVASGGELSRVLLACRQLISTKDLVTIFLFDEIDSGMGGETALKMAHSLKRMALNSQLLVITHLPQLAHLADQLIVVSKEKEKSEGDQKWRTQSLISEVKGREKRGVIQQMTPLTPSL